VTDFDQCLTHPVAINQAINQEINQSSDQSINHTDEGTELAISLSTDEIFWRE